VSPAAERARLFVALELPADVVDALVTWRSRALTAIDGLRLLPRESLHVTLCFLGSQRVDDVDAIADTCVRAVTADATGADAAPAAPSGLSLSDLVWLPRRHPGVAAVRIDDPHGSLAALQSTLAAALVSGGWCEPEARAYLPHVTLARVGRRGRVRPPADAPPPPGLRFSGRAVTLFRSHPGSSYEPLHSTHLSAPANVGDPYIK
jgi:2'-5' RNA ligase